jgi:hypothetical protein
LGNFRRTLEEFLAVAIVRLDLHDDITVADANVASLYYQLVTRQYHADKVDVISARNQLVHISEQQTGICVRENTFRMTLRNSTFHISASSRTGPQTLSDGSGK